MALCISVCSVEVVWILRSVSEGLYLACLGI